MKRLGITVITLVSMSFAAFAQHRGDMAAGVNVMVTSPFGVGAKLQYNIRDHIRLEGSLTDYFPWGYSFRQMFSDKVVWDFGVNAHCLLPLSTSERVNIYPLTGLSIMGASYKYVRIVYNVGGGIDFRITPNIILNGEVKYRTVSDGNGVYASVGAAYLF